jgi:hypothetical protein
MSLPRFSSLFEHTRPFVIGVLSLAVVAAGFNMTGPLLGEIDAPPHILFPTVNPQHKHARALLNNAMGYLAPECGIKDVSSGYPVEGWNNEPDRELGLRSFTQLTAIGEWTELLANVVAGNADSPYLTREQALSDLQQVVRSLLQDQRDPKASAKGLLANFLNLAQGKRMGPLGWVAEKKQFIEKFGDKDGSAIWEALCAKGWLSPQANGREAAIMRNAAYGADFFNGPLAQYSDQVRKDAIMALLDQRTVTIVFGDNVNLSTSVATAIGALMSPDLRGNPAIHQIRKEMEQFLENQREGYSFLYDNKMGLFYFGWDAGRNRLLGWEDAEGNLRPGHMDYMVNEFRGPTAFVVMRYGLPETAFANLGFTMKPYRLADRRDLHVLSPWEGSAFQGFGLSLSVADGGYRSWHVLLKHLVEVEIDYSRRHQLPGFLSESYVGEGARYTGDVGIPDIAVNSSPRITHVASLYTLGVAYTIAPSEVEQFLEENWATISTLLTNHGPWEGFDIRKQKPVRIQTTAHTLSLVLGLLGTGPGNMMRYLDSKGLHPKLKEIYKPGERVDLLSGNNNCFAWDVGGSKLQSERGTGEFNVNGVQVKQLGVAFVSNKQGMNLSNGLLTLRYRSSRPLLRAKIQLKTESRESLLPIELFVRLPQTDDREQEIQVTLPATVGLSQIKEAVLECDPAEANGNVHLSITHFQFTPFSS